MSQQSPRRNELHSTPLQNELQAFVGESHNVSCSEMQANLLSPSSRSYRTPDHTAPLLELPVSLTTESSPGENQPPLEMATAASSSSSHQPFNVSSHYTVPFAQATESGTGLEDLRARRAIWQDSAPELATQSLRIAPDHPESGMNMLWQMNMPESLLHSDVACQEPMHLASEHTSPSLASRQTQSPFVTFNCNRAVTCDRHCSCVCHSSHRYKSPEVLKKLLGSLFVGYTGLPISASICKSNKCSNHAFRSVKASYIFPFWFVMKTLDLVFKSSYASGPCISLSVRNRVIMGAGINIVSLARNGDTSGIMKLLERQKASITDVDSLTGQSAFIVCNNSTISILSFIALYSKSCF